MSTRFSAYPPEQAAVSSGGGCLSGYLLPPLAVVFIGALLTVLAFTSTITATPAEAQYLQTSVMNAEGSHQQLSPVFTPEVQYWAGRIVAWATTAGLDPNLVATVMQIESCGDPRALSGSGAMGLFQVMPYHFTASDDPYTPATNALRGLDYLRRSLEAAHGDARLALAGYNGGIGVISWAESAWPLQTQRYAYWGSGIYTDASSGMDASPRLQEWLRANGISLCRQAHDRLGINP
jgi:soluble lytic murein transglycosylase-like protein